MPSVRELVAAIPGFWPHCPACGATVPFPATGVRDSPGGALVSLACPCGHTWDIT